MKKDEKEIEVKEFKEVKPIEEAKPKVVAKIEKSFLVIKDFTLDKQYRRGDNIKLKEEKTISELLTNKLIK